MKEYLKTTILCVLSILLLLLADLTPASAAPKILTPSAGSTLSGSTATFTWTANGASLTNWSLRVGTSAGDSSIYNSGNLSSGTLARTVSGLPTNGSTIWVRLQWRFTNGTWGSTDVRYTTGSSSGSTSTSTSSSTTTSTSSSSTSNDGSGRPKLLTPSAGSTLSGSTTTFTWTANGASLTNWVVRVGTSAGDSSIYNSGNLSSGTLAKTASGLPTDGSTIWVRLQWRFTNGTWGSTDVRYTTGSSSGSTSTSTSSSTTTSTSSSSTSNDGSGRPKLLTPSAGSTLSGSTTTFTWTANGASLTNWVVRVGTSAGDSSIYNSGNLSSGTLAKTASGLPTDGSTIWVRLQWRFTNGTWGSTDVRYTTGSSSGSTSTSTSSSTTTSTSSSSTSNDGSGRPKLLTPSAGSTLSGSTTTFTWTANGASLTNWVVRVGTSAGDSSIYNSGNLSSGTLARTVSGLPTNGSTIWVRLQWRFTNGTWGSTDVRYTTGSSSGSTSTSTSSSTTTSTSGTNYYVSTSGNNANAGTKTSPFRSIKYGLSKLKAGSTLFIRSGTYSESLVSWSGTKFPSGTSWTNPVRIKAYNGESVTLKGNIDISLASPSIQYLIFDRIKIDAAGKDTAIAITGNANHIRFQNGEIKNAKRWGVLLSYHNASTFPNTFHEFLNMNIHHNGTTKNVDHGLYIKTSGNLINHCNIHNNAAWGIHNFVQAGDPKANNNTYRNNLVHHNGIALQQGGGITIGAGDNNTAYNNVVWKNQSGIIIQPYQNPRNTSILHNSIYDNVWQGIVIEQGAQDSDVFNNISYKNITNILDRGTRTTIGYNLTGNPSFKNPSASDFHLQSGSAAIDTGTTINSVKSDRDGRSRPQGIRPDIGAYEWKN